MPHASEDHKSSKRKYTGTRQSEDKFETVSKKPKTEERNGQKEYDTTLSSISTLSLQADSLEHQDPTTIEDNSASQENTTVEDNRVSHEIKRRTLTEEEKAEHTILDEQEDWFQILIQEYAQTVVKLSRANSIEHAIFGQLNFVRFVLDAVEEWDNVWDSEMFYLSVHRFTRVMVSKVYIRLIR
jgi:hypothetical protein